MTKASLLSIALLPLALAACSMSPPDDGSLPVPEGGSFKSLALQGEQIAATYGADDPTLIASMPANGVGVYRGIAAFGDAEKYDTQEELDAAEIADLDAIGRVTMTADFETGAIDGSIHDIKAKDNSNIDGAISIDGDITKNLIAAQLSGTISNGGVSTDVTGTLAGGFVGDKADAVVGEFLGDLSNPLFGYNIFYGGFGASLK